MVNIKRWFRHALMPPWRWRVLFPKATLSGIEDSLRNSSCQHLGELHFAVENALAPGKVWRGMSARQRAIEVFSNLRLWDTEENSGVLIYLLLADRAVHVVADRGINKHVAQAEWDAVVKSMEKEFRQGDFLSGSLQGIERTVKLLACHFPCEAEGRTGFSCKPVIIKH